MPIDGIVELLPVAVSSDVVECLTDLLAQAKKGEITGLAFAAVLKKRRYIVSSAGTAARYPTFTRGMIRALDDDLRDRVRKGK